MTISKLREYSSKPALLFKIRTKEPQQASTDIHIPIWNNCSFSKKKKQRQMSFLGTAHLNWLGKFNSYIGPNVLNLENCVVLTPKKKEEKHKCMDLGLMPPKQSQAHIKFSELLIRAKFSKLKHSVNGLFKQDIHL